MFFIFFVFMLIEQKIMICFQVLEDVTEFETTPEGKKITKLEQILLNGNNITMLVPGGDGPEEA